MVATLGLVAFTFVVGDDGRPTPAEVDAAIAVVREAHGHVGPWALVGYRAGIRARSDFGLPRHSRAWFVVHHTPLVFKYTCAADGVMAATGATPGKMSLEVKEAAEDGLRTEISDRSTGRVLTFRVKPALAREMFAVTPEQLDAMTRRIGGMTDDEIFEIAETRVEPTVDLSKERILP
jgi:formylmethanofuran dehydrogenase subunit E